MSRAGLLFIKIESIRYRDIGEQPLVAGNPCGAAL
jgi:hypothetical protein